MKVDKLYTAAQIPAAGVNSLVVRTGIEVKSLELHDLGVVLTCKERNGGAVFLIPWSNITAIVSDELTKPKRGRKPVE